MRELNISMLNMQENVLLFFLINSRCWQKFYTIASSDKSQQFSTNQKISVDIVMRMTWFTIRVLGRHPLLPLTLDSIKNFPSRQNTSIVLLWTNPPPYGQNPQPQVFDFAPCWGALRLFLHFGEYELWCAHGDSANSWAGKFMRCTATSAD